MYNGEVNAGAHVTFKGLYPSGDLASGSHVISVATVRGSTFKSSFNIYREKCKDDKNI